MIREKRKPEAKFLYSVCLIAAVISAVAFLWWHGDAVPLKGIGNLEVVQRSIPGQKPAISVSGVIIDSRPGMTVTSVSQRQNGHLIILIVRKGFRPGGLGAGKFSAEIIVLDNVDAVAFERPEDVIWQR